MAAPRRTGKKRITLEHKADPGCEVFVAGTFNNWDPTHKPMKAVDGVGHYKAVLVVPPGVHEYKFIVNGNWQIDGSNPDWIANGVGSLNSVVNVE